MEKGDNLFIETPLIESTCLSRRFGYNVFLKLENLQPSGSFKMRGLGHRCKKEIANGCTHIIIPSGGNAGLAAARAGYKLGVKTTVVVPETTAEETKQKIRDEGAEVVAKGQVFKEAKAMAENLGEKPGHFFVHPFDHPDIWEGNATMVKEIASVMTRKPSVVVLSVGGGGLLCGVLQGLQEVGWTDVPVVAMETVGADAFSLAIRAGKLVTLSEITSVAKCLGAPIVCQQSLDWLKHHQVISHVVSDYDAVYSCVKFSDDHQMLVAPACGATLSAVYCGVLQTLNEQGVLKELKDVVVIVCGGSISLQKLNELKKDFKIND